MTILLSCCIKLKDGSTSNTFPSVELNGKTRRFSTAVGRDLNTVSGNTTLPPRCRVKKLKKTKRPDARTDML